MEDETIHMCKLARNNQSIISNQCLPRRSYPLLPTGSQRNISYTGMSAVERPLRLAMPDDEDAGCGHLSVVRPETGFVRGLLSDGGWVVLFLDSMLEGS